MAKRSTKNTPAVAAVPNAPAVPTQKEKAARVRDLLSSPAVKSQIELALPQYLDANRFARITMTTLQLNPKLLDCDVVSLISAVMQCAQLGVEPDNVLGHAYLVPFKGRVQIILGYRGILKLARNSERVLSIEAREVYTGDEFDYRYGDVNARHLRHVPTEKPQPGKLRAAYAVARFVGGGEVWEVVLPRHIAKVKRLARGSEKADSPWKLHEGEMWRKTAVRRLEPFLPLDATARRAFAVDEAGERGDVQFLDMDISPEAAQRQDALDALAQSVENEADGGPAPPDGE